jgi:hypothetical protein
MKKQKLIRDTIIDGNKYDIYQIYCLSYNGVYEDCGYDVVTTSDQKSVITFIGYPTDEDIKRGLNKN